MKITGFLKRLCTSFNYLTVSFLTAGYIVLIDNQMLWHNLASRLDLGTPSHWQLALTFGAIMLLLTQILLLLGSFRCAFKPFLVTLLLTAAAISYFTDGFGVIIDKSMIRNILETNFNEAGELITWSLIWHVLLYGGLPAILVILAPIRFPTWQFGWLQRTSGIAVSLLLVAALLATNYKELSLFGRKNNDLRMYINPIFPIVSVVKVLKSESVAHADEPPMVIAPDANREPAKHRSVVVLVVGETARAQELAYNGYPRNTTPYTGNLGIINFTDVASCGTATAISVPCLFSPLDKDQFSSSAAEQEENLLDILQRTGVEVDWRDNDSGSKGVARRVNYENFSDSTDTRFCSNGNCYDEILVSGLDEMIKKSQNDTLIVLHLKGSHGPSYYKRSPEAIKAFSPECAQDSVQDCTQQAIVNAYDNTIVYTDYILSKVVNLLQAQATDTAMLYISDHGESLGENGIYLHGLPYAIAPNEQTHVPMIFWGSDGFLMDHHIDRDILISRQNRHYSQDYVFHSLLGLFNIRTHVYQKNLDLFSTNG